MNRAASAAAAWGSLVVLLGAGLAVWSGGIGTGLLLAQGGLFLLAIAWMQARLPASTEARVLPRTSLPTVVLAAGLCAAALGLTAGLWLGLVGAELALFGLIWLARELRQERGRTR